MVGYGAKVSEADHKAIVNYLTSKFGVTSAVKVNINTATAEEMASLLRLTPKEADAIVKYRQQHGNFKDWYGLYKVDGVSAIKIEAARAMDLIAM
jgi:competence protein ComEA